MFVLLVNGKNCQTGALMMNQKGKSKAVFGLQFPRKEIRGYCNLLMWWMEIELLTLFSLSVEGINKRLCCCNQLCWICRCILFGRAAYSAPVISSAVRVGQMCHKAYSKYANFSPIDLVAWDFLFIMIQSFFALDFMTVWYSCTQLDAGKIDPDHAAAANRCWFSGEVKEYGNNEAPNQVQIDRKCSLFPEHAHELQKEKLGWTSEV